MDILEFLMAKLKLVNMFDFDVPIGIIIVDGGSGPKYGVKHSFSSTRFFATFDQVIKYITEFDFSVK